MKPAHVLLQALLVVAGLFVYDQFRGGEPPGAPADLSPDRSPKSAPEVSRGVSAPPDPRIDALIRRVSALETRLESATRQGARPGPPPHGAAPPRPTIPDAGSVRVPAAAPVVDEHFSTDEVARFRALQGAAERQRRLEGARTQIGKRLDAVPGTLTAEDRARVLDESLRAWLRAREVRAQRPVDFRGAAARLRADYAGAVGRILRGSHADAIVEYLAPTLGLTPSALQPDDEAR